MLAMGVRLTIRTTAAAAGGRQAEAEGRSELLRLVMKLSTGQEKGQTGAAKAEPGLDAGLYEKEL